MAQLHQVVGAVLRDIAQARVTSDLYTRDVSQYYEQDSLLRIFPVPRSEISEVDIDLRFAISKIEPDPDRITEKDAKTGGILDRYSGPIVDSIFDGLTSTDTAKGNPNWLEVIHNLDTLDFRTDLRTNILDCLEKNAYGLIDRQNNLLDVEALLDLLKGVAEESVYQRAEVASFIEDTKFSGPVKISVTTRMKSDLESMRVEIEFARSAAEDYVVEVHVTSAELQEVPETALSSIKLTTSVRNYTWSKVEQKGKTSIYQLGEE